MQPLHASTGQRQDSARLPEASDDLALALQTAFRLGLAYGRFVYRFRRLLLVFWLVALVARVPFTTRLPSHLNSGGFSVNGSESAQVSDSLIKQLHVPPSSLTVVFSNGVHWLPAGSNRLSRAIR